jgi:hypothetical protein
LAAVIRTWNPNQLHWNWRAEHDRRIKKRCAIKTRTSDVEICLLKKKKPQVKYRQVSKGKIEALNIVSLNRQCVSGQMSQNGREACL